MTTITPHRSNAQRLTALELANAIRIERAALKRSLKAGELDILKVIEDPPECLLTARVAKVIGSCKGYGEVKVAEVLGECGVSNRKKLGGISERQRSALLDVLSGISRRGDQCECGEAKPFRSVMCAACRREDVAA
jgi:hypothetical protein